MKIEPVFNADEIARREKFVTALWKGEQTEKVAFQVVGEAYQELPCTLKELEDDPAKFLVSQLTQQKARLAYDDYTIPMIIPYPSVLAIASAFGCAIVRESDNTPPNAAPVISSAKEVDRKRVV